MPLTQVSPTLLDSQASAQGFRNRIINGDMRIDQRNAGASVTPTATVYTLDRWQLAIAQASKLSFQQNAGSVTPPSGFVNYLGLTSLSAYSITSTDYFILTQAIEGNNMADFGWGTSSAQSVMLSFWVRSSLTGTFGGVVTNGTRAYPFTYSISAANTWEQKTVPIPGDTSGTWATNNTTGAIVQFGLGVGSTRSGTAGAWATGVFNSATGATSVVGTSGATFYITGVQLEVGTAATPFERIDYGRQLIQCQRYFESNYDIGVAPGNGVGTGDGYKAGVQTAAQLYGLHQIKFQVAKRANPSFVFYRPSTTATNGQWGYYSGSAWVSGTGLVTDSSCTTSFGIVMGSTGLTNQNAYILQGGWTASAEL